MLLDENQKQKANLQYVTRRGLVGFQERIIPNRVEQVMIAVDAEKKLRMAAVNGNV